MSNAYLSDDNEIYNKEIKDAFISRYPEHTHNIYRRVFFYSSPIEHLYGIDLFEFNLKQIGDVLKSMNPSSLASVKSTVSVIKAYIDWAIHRRSNNINPLDITDVTWEKQFVDTTKKLLFNYDEIWGGVIKNCKNAQDSLIVALLFEGVGGREVFELRNLNIRDVNFEEGVLNLTNEKGEQRQIKVSSETLSLIRDAEIQTEYYKRNGEISPNSRNRKETSQLIETGYLIKPAKTKVVHVEQVNTHVIYGRLSTLSEIFNIPNFSVKNIQRSGMLYMAKRILDRDGYFSNKEQYLEICEQFGVAKIDNNGYESYNWFGMKNFINLDNIQQLYGAKNS